MGMLANLFLTVVYMMILYVSILLLYHYGYRIIIIIQMSLMEAGSLVGGVIGSPASLDMKKVDAGAPPASTSRPPQQSTTMGGAGAPPAMNRSSYNPSGVALSW